jgi:hypothetical protein
MTWAGGVGSGNLLLDPTDAFAAGSASITNFFTGSLTLASGFAVQTAANVGGSAAAIVGRPEFYHEISFRGTAYLVPVYRKA